MLAGFKKFLFRGNVIDLAVAVVIGAAFGTRFFRALVYRQRQHDRLRRVPECPDRIRVGGARRLLLCGRSRERLPGASQARRGSI